MIVKTYNNLMNEYNSGILAYSTIGIIGQSCMGSVAVMFLLMNNNLADTPKMIELFIVTMLCMGFNGTVLSQQTGKVQFNTLIVSVFASVLIAVLNLI